ncbi:uncharacterized protein G2W53_028383 [Senna tora]|uniref:Uncharacterized protein n=1 Tax=Senna tora TaxID=362788 RepID=A0A834WEQ5_9FABA|nr:uncharacterized protein G2W53_028383 [Senna tora]
MDVFVRRTISVVDVLENVLDNFHGAMNMSIGNNNAAYSLPLEFKQSIEQIQNLFDVTSSIPRDGAKKVVHVVNQFLDVV